MPLVSFKEMMEDAEKGGYAVGYFESWNLESLQAVWEAAEETRSPVILGFSGVQLPDPRRVLPENLEPYAAMGLALCKLASVPTSLIFNESTCLDWIKKAIDEGFNVVMFSDQKCTFQEQKRKTIETVAMAHTENVAVEGELRPLPLSPQERGSVSSSSLVTDPIHAAEFIDETGVDALAVAIGNIHFAEAENTDLDIQRLDAIREHVSVPLVLHAGSGLKDEAVKEVIQHGIRKINVGSALRRAFFNTMKEKIAASHPFAHPYDIIGSGLDEDVLLAGKIALKNLIREKMVIFGSAGKA